MRTVRDRTRKTLLKKYPLAMFYCDEQEMYVIFTSTWREVWQSGLYVGMRQKTKLKKLVSKRGKDKILSGKHPSIALAWDDAIKRYG